MLLIWLDLLLLFFVAHPIHVSVTEVAYNQERGTLEIVHKIFIDDFEDVLKKYDDLPFRLGTEREMEGADAFITKYLNRKFRVKVNGEWVEPNFLGKETDLEAVWAYQEITGINELKSLSFNQTVLFDLFDDQKNLLHLSFFGKKRSFLFKQGNETETLNL